MSNDYGLKISRPGYSIRNPDIQDKDLVFSSELNTPKLYRIIKFEKAGETQEIEHGMSYPPLYMYFTEKSTDSGKWQLTTSSYFNPVSRVQVDSTKVYCLPSETTYVLLFTDRIDE